jgi:hypothetical protein
MKSVDRKKIFAVLSVGAAAYAVFMAFQRAGKAAEEAAGQRRLSTDVVLASVLAVAALALAFKKAGDATKKVTQAF